MADLSITAANVKPTGTEFQPRFVQAGEAITQGESVHLKASDSKWWLADNDALESAGSGGVGIALTPAATDGYFLLAHANGNQVDLGATLVNQETYVVSSTAGGIAPIGDLASGDYLTYLGYANGTANLVLFIKAAGVQQ